MDDVAESEQEVFVFVFNLFEIFVEKQRFSPSLRVLMSANE
jgi:hypothetical protein